MKSLLDPSFNYVPSIRTDLRETFARVRKEQREKAIPLGQLYGKSNIAPLFRTPKHAVK